MCDTDEGCAAVILAPDPPPGLAAPPVLKRRLEAWFTRRTNEQGAKANRAMGVLSWEPSFPGRGFKLI